MGISARQSIEAFHLIFLRGLVAKGEDKALIALKGGCNLRFYFGSIRYSEDIDFDVVVMAKDTLRNKVDRLLRSPLVQSPLRAKGIEVVDTSTPKQTETTQRWKVGLKVQGVGIPLRTKIEFSRRDEIAGALFESVSAEVLKPYSLTSTLATHYAAHAAIAQKIHALAGRTEPQARDVFDLHLLFARPDAGGLDLPVTHRGPLLGKAIDHAVGISYDEYKAKVVGYLDPGQAGPYEGRSAWDTIQGDVVSRLEALV